VLEIYVSVFVTEALAVLVSLLVLCYEGFW
jgi:hypothetical protein